MWHLTACGRHVLIDRIKAKLKDRHVFLETSQKYTYPRIIKKRVLGLYVH